MRETLLQELFKITYRTKWSFCWWKAKCTLSFPNTNIKRIGTNRRRDPSLSQALHAWILSEIHFFISHEGFTASNDCLHLCSESLFREAVALLRTECLGMVLHGPSLKCQRQERARRAPKDIRSFAWSWADRKWLWQPGLLILGAGLGLLPKCWWPQTSLHPCIVPESFSPGNLIIEIHSHV